MDIDDPAEDLKYVSIEPELIARGITRILEVDRTPREELSQIACLGDDGARRLHTYIRDRLLPIMQHAQDRDRVSSEKMTCLKLRRLKTRRRERES